MSWATREPININDSKITGLANTFYSGTTAWLIAAVVIGAYTAVTLWSWRQRVKAGLSDRDLLGP